MKARTRRLRYLREAACTLVVARLAVRFASARHVFRWADRSPPRVNRFASGEADWVAWAVEATAGWRWMKAPALARALAMQAMLRRRGLAGRLCLGVANSTTLTVHAWIELDGRALTGGDLSGMARLAEFGGR